MANKESVRLGFLLAFCFVLPKGFAEGKKVTLTGHLVDQMCGGGVREVSKAKEHSKEWDRCARSGYGIFADGRFINLPGKRTFKWPLKELKMETSSLWPASRKNSPLIFLSTRRLPAIYYPSSRLTALTFLDGGGILCEVLYREEETTSPGSKKRRRLLFSWAIALYEQKVYGSNANSASKLFGRRIWRRILMFVLPVASTSKYPPRKGSNNYLTGENSRNTTRSFTLLIRCTL